WMQISLLCYLVFFFFQAEDGIRDFHVTGVQTCALPICTHSPHPTHVDSPIGSSKSKTIFAELPRFAYPITSLTWTSRHARTQRVHWMHDSRCTWMPGCERSGTGCDRMGKRPARTPSCAAQ